MQAAIGRPLPGGAATQSVNLALPGQVYGPRISTVDLRVTKLLRFGRTRTNVGLDLYNLFNDNTGTAFNQAFGTDGLTWLRPTAVMSPRFVQIQRHAGFLIADGQVGRVRGELAGQVETCPTHALRSKALSLLITTTSLATRDVERLERLDALRTLARAPR